MEFCHDVSNFATGKGSFFNFLQIIEIGHSKLLSLNTYVY